MASQPRAPIKGPERMLSSTLPAIAMFRVRTYIVRHEKISLTEKLAVMVACPAASREQTPLVKMYCRAVADGGAALARRVLANYVLNRANMC